MTNIWHEVEPGTKDALNVVIEIPKLSRVKYELDKKTGLIRFDRVLYSPMHYPANYGFVPRTLWGDGDPLDVLVLGHETLVPGCLIEARPIGVLPMNDSGEDDAKILAVPTADPRYKEIRNYNDIEPHILEEIRHFFQVYKNLQKKEVVVGDWKDAKEAEACAEKSFKLYREKYGK